MLKRQNRIFIGPTEVAGQYRNLALSLLDKNVACEYYTFYQNEFDYGGDIGSSKIPNLMRRLNSFGKKYGKLARLLSVILFEILRLVFFLIQLTRFDTYYFGFGVSLLRGNIDLQILKLFRKRIVVNLAHGSEMTPSYLDGALLNARLEMPPLKSLIRSTKKKKRCVEKFEQHADLIIGSPLSSSFLATKPYIDIIRLGRTCQAQNIVNLMKIRSKYDAQRSLDASSNLIRVLHIPSHAPGKGTHLIRSAMQQVMSESAGVRYEELSGLSNNEVLKRLSEADLLVDQVFSDLPLSGVGMEAMVLGVPVLVSGYGLLDLSLRYTRDEFPPSIICDPGDLVKEIKFLVNNQKILKERGKAGQKFVHSNWSRENVSARYAYLLTGKLLPSAWWHDPKNHCYLYGYGLQKNKVEQIIGDLVKSHDLTAMSLTHRPDLQAELIKLVPKQVKQAANIDKFGNKRNL